MTRTRTAGRTCSGRARRTAGAAFAAAALAATSLVLVAGPAAAAGPARDTSVTDEPFLVDCGTFSAEVAGTVTTRSTAFFNSADELVTFRRHVMAPRDVWRNTTKGASVVVRGNFVQTYSRVPGTDTFSVAISGFRYLVNAPDDGVVVQEVGRVVYADPSEQQALFLAGQHQLVDATRVEPTFCTLIA